MNIGIAGCGTIVPVFLEAQKKIQDFHITAICSTPHSEEKRRALALEYGIKQTYADYGEMLRDGELDCIYIAVPNHLHASFCRQALEQGKSVICEKPFCSNLEEAEKLATMAKEKQLFLFEAISNQYLPTYETVKELLPQLGKIRIVECNFSQYSSRYDAFCRGELPPVFDVAKNGGALMDLNVYNIHFVTGLFGSPQTVQYFPNRNRGVDTSGVLILTYPDFLCVLIGAKDCQASSSVKIQGEHGYIYSESPTNAFESFSFVQNNRLMETYRLPQGANRLYYELQAFADMVRRQDWEQHETRLAQTLRVQQVLEAAGKA